MVDLEARLAALDGAFVWARRIVALWRQTGRVERGSLNVFWLPEMAPFRRDPPFHEPVRELDMLRF